VLTPLAFPGATAYSTNLANVFFGIGAFLTPLAVAFLVRRLGYAPSLILLGCLTLMPVLLALGVEVPTARDAGGAAGQGVGALLGNRVLWLCGLAMFFYGPLEASMGAWTTTYLRNRGLREGAAAGLLSAFWLTFMATRLVTAFGLPEGAEAILILTLA